jgi:hypothetical protein
MPFGYAGVGNSKGNQFTFAAENPVVCGRWIDRNVKSANNVDRQRKGTFARMLAIENRVC